MFVPILRYLLLLFYLCKFSILFFSVSIGWNYRCKCLGASASECFSKTFSFRKTEFFFCGFSYDRFFLGTYGIKHLTCVEIHIHWQRINTCLPCIQWTSSVTNKTQNSGMREIMK